MHRRMRWCICGSTVARAAGMIRRITARRWRLLHLVLHRGILAVCVFKETALVATVGSHGGVALTHNPSDRSMHWPRSRGCGCCWHPAADVHVPAADAVATDDAARGNVHVVFPCKMQSVSKCSRYNKAKPGESPLLVSLFLSLTLVCRINFALSFRLRIIIISGNG